MNKFAILRNPNTDKNVALVVHSLPEEQLYFATSDSSLQEAFEITENDLTTVAECKNSGNVTACYEKTIGKESEEFLIHYIEKFLNPLEIANLGSTKLDPHDALQYFSNYIADESD